MARTPPSALQLIPSPPGRYAPQAHADPSEPSGDGADPPEPSGAGNTLRG